MILAPAMHTQMWEHPATQANVQTLRSWGYHVIEPAIGRLTGPDSGPGRMPEPEDIFAVALDVIARFPKGQVHPVYTPGYAPTEPLYTGTEQERMAAARAATLTSALLGQVDSGKATGASESLRGPLAGRLVVITAGGTREALDPVRFLGNRSTGKAREAGESTLGPKLIVGFAAETGSAEKAPLELGREKLQRKGTDFLAVNTVGVNRGFGTDDNTITLLSTLNDEAPVFSGSKKELSVRLLEHVAAFLPELSG